MLPDTHDDSTLAAAPQVPDSPPVASEGRAGDAALLGELAELLHRKRWNAIEISNLAFILRHRDHVRQLPEAERALVCVERYGRELLSAGAGATVGEEARIQAIRCLERAAELLGAGQVLQSHEQNP